MRFRTHPMARNAGTDIIIITIIHHNNYMRQGQHGTHPRNVSQLLDDEVQGPHGVAHAAQEEDLLPHQPPGLALLQGCLQGVGLAGHEEGHQPLWIVLRVQLHLQSETRGNMSISLIHLQALPLSAESAYMDDQW